ncbi:MAG: hypothetical protein PUC44_04815, partial [Eubacteriales bacterium]|nr:hypothetical protein [Eubacteriales bacterium]
MQYVDLVIDNKSRSVDRMYTYSTEKDLPVGSVVKVPFNQGNSLRTGYVLRSGVKPDPSVKNFKMVAERIPYLSLTEEMVTTAVWMRRRYGIRYIDAIKCFLPGGKPPKPGKEKEP